MAMEFDLPLWMIAIGAFFALVLGIAAFRAKVRTFVSELEWWGTLATQRKEAIRELGPDGEPATSGELQDATAEIMAELRALRVERQAEGRAAPVDADEDRRTEQAVTDILRDPGLAARMAEDAFREGRVDEALGILRRDAEAGAAETAERWRRLGALARGINTKEALEAYEAAFRLQLSLIHI